VAEALLFFASKRAGNNTGMCGWRACTHVDRRRGVEVITELNFMRGSPNPNHAMLEFLTFVVSI
jgi:hypothetical protein